MPNFSIEGTNGTLNVYDECVEIVRSRSMFNLGGGIGDKRFFFSNIISIEFKEFGLLSGNGYMQFISAGTQAVEVINMGVHTMRREAMRAPNVIFWVGYGRNKKFRQAYEFINNKMEETHSTVSSSAVTSISDEIERLSCLKDKGILSQEEFASAKEKLLK